MTNETLGSGNIVICENLVRIYKVADLEVVALQGLDLLVRRGEMLGIVGTSGSGKTTLMNVLGGLDRPSAGRVVVDDENLLELTEAELNRYQRDKVGFVWQQTSRNLIPYLSAVENIELPMTMAGRRSRREKREWATHLLDAVGLYERRHHRLTQLSGGEQQRVAIAVAMANKPVLLLGDEPTGEVDSQTAQVVMNTFHKMSADLGLTIIIVTHDPRIAEMVDRVVAIRDGKISTETIRQAGQLEKAMAGAQPAGKEEVNLAPEVIFNEYVVLDTAGRLQLPREWLEQLGIHKRAQLERGEDSIIVRPAAGQTGEVRQQKLTLEEQIALLFAEEPAQPSKNPLRRWGRSKKHASRG